MNVLAPTVGLGVTASFPYDNSLVLLAALPRPPTHLTVSCVLSSHVLLFAEGRRPLLLMFAEGRRPLLLKFWTVCIVMCSNNSQCQYSFMQERALVAACKNCRTECNDMIIGYNPVFIIDFLPKIGYATTVSF